MRGVASAHLLVVDVSDGVLADEALLVDDDAAGLRGGPDLLRCIRQEHPSTQSEPSSFRS